MEILGGNLDLAFKELEIKAVKTYQSSESEYQVWELSDNQYDKLLFVSDNQWQDGYGWWRTGSCIYKGNANYEYKVNGHLMKGYSEDDEIYHDLHSILQFDSYTEWLSEVMYLTTETNKAIFAYSLASDNDLSLSDFMKKYQP